MKEMVVFILKQLEPDQLAPGEALGLLHSAVLCAPSNVTCIK